MMDNNAFINEIAGFATLAICIMTFVTFMVTVGAWEPSFWESNMEIMDYEGYWGEDLVVIYNDGTTESVKAISNSIWSTMAIENEGSRTISDVQYCLNTKIPTSDVFDTRYYYCDISIVQNGIDFYQTSYTTTGFVDVKANEWVRVITVSLDIQTISSSWNDGVYRVSFDNMGTIEGIDVPDGRSIDIFVDDGIVTFLI